MKPVLAVALVGSLLAAVALIGLPQVAVVRPATPASLSSGDIEVESFLPRPAPRSGTVDVTRAVQLALDAAGGRRVLLPPFPLLVSPPKGRNACLTVRGGVTLVGRPGSLLITRTPAVQLLRVEDGEGVRIEDVALEGVGGVGARLGHGLVQLWRCTDVSISKVSVRHADADGIAISESENVRVEDCLVEGASKAGIYLSNCTAAVVRGNIVRDGIGHIAPNGLTVGTGILLLSNADLVCSSNVIAGGVGPGILCSSNENQRAPDGISIVGNRIRDCVNPLNPATSSGIQLANVQLEKRTHVLVASNSIRGCGQHGILVENHDGAVIQDNVIEDSWMSAITVGHASGVRVEGNTVIDGNRSGAGGQAAVYLHSTTSQCSVQSTSVIALQSPALAPVIDRAPLGANVIQ